MKLRSAEQEQGWVSGKFLHPHDACFDAAGNIFVAEWVNTGRITKLRRVSLPVFALGLPASGTRHASEGVGIGGDALKADVPIAVRCFDRPPIGLLPAR